MYQLLVMVHETALVSLLTTRTSSGPTSHTKLEHMLIWKLCECVHIKVANDSSFFSFLSADIEVMFCFTLLNLRTCFYESKPLAESCKCCVASNIARPWEGRGKSCTTMRLSPRRTCWCCNIRWVSTCICLSTEAFQCE